MPSKKQLDNKEEIIYLKNLRHSCAHLLAASVEKLYPEVKLTIGPAIESGFYYDFDFGNIKISDSDLERIEKKMYDLLSSWTSFERIEVSKSEALKHFSKNKYKKELIEEFDKGKQQLTLYKAGNFTDLCRGGHIENPDKELKHFKLLSIAGAYWRGDEKNKMLTRIYGCAFPSKKELDTHIWQLEEAKKRDHRKLGQKLGLYTISDKVGRGLVLWLPNGNIVRETLMSWAKNTEKEWGYQHVSTPHITKSELYYTSGHLPYYKDDMYPPMVLDDNEEYFLKPMNCPHHHIVYDSQPKSYRDLPVRLAEYGMCYRYEASGELFGLMRVRSLEINDAHIYCSEEQAVDEFVKIMKLHEYYYKSLGITNYHLELALRDPKNKDKYHGDKLMWQKAEELMRKAVEKVDIKMVEEIGSAAFYGPKIDFIIHSSIGREFAISTNQIDLYMGNRFNLKYVDKNGKEQTPVIIHRAPLGTNERFIGFLIEHYAGKFPVWLAPVQIALIPIADRHEKHAQKIASQLIKENIRTEVDSRSETMQAKIRDHTLQKVPYMGIIGDKEIESDSIAIRTREGKDLGSVKVQSFLTTVRNRIEKKT